MDQRLQDPAVAAPPDWRGLCEELLRELENAIAVHYGEGGTHHISAADAVIARADAALAQPEPEGRPAPAPAGDCPACEGTPKPGNQPCAVCGRLASVVDGEEVAGLAWWLRSLEDASVWFETGSPEAQRLARAADLLEQRQSAPVPVASDVHFEFVVSDADCCTQAGGIAPTYAQALSEGQHYLAQYLQDGPHTLELRRVEVVPLPSVEVEA